jgi:hypothetical protein
MHCTMPLPAAALCTAEQHSSVHAARPQQGEFTQCLIVTMVSPASGSDHYVVYPAGLCAMEELVAHADWAYVCAGAHALPLLWLNWV